MEVKGIELLNNLKKFDFDMILINYVEKKDFIEDCFFGNVVLVVFIIVYVWLYLYDILEKLGECVFYFDIDSIIY